MRAVLLSLFFLSQLTVAESFLGVGTGINYFDYQEFDEFDQTLNKETGYLPGVSLSYHYLKDSFGIRLAGGYFSGEVDYSGETQTGAPLKTQTEETLFDLETELLWHPVTPDLGFYAKLQWFEWQRRILASTRSIELYEVYQWQNVEAGFVANLVEFSQGHVTLKFGLAHTKNGRIRIDLSQLGFGEPQLQLGDGSGTSASLTYYFMQTNSSRLSVSLNHREWSFKDSNRKSISNGSTILSIREPKSDSKRTGIVLNYQYKLGSS